ncbi:MAG: hypothetical protein KAS63_10490 [Candidatus Heimdallarchaeota archaeon]|nr:hypothetical protein [Candidatus Heimdallarchaeota archaeon]MCK4955782.1 hypothetical protein [Candidatus Heimdallarchaeota archaeon]
MSSELFLFLMNEKIPSVTASDGNSYDTIHVKYDDSFVLGFDDVDEVDVFYDAQTGLILRSIEKDTASNSQVEFLPSEVVIKRAGLIPFPFTGVIVSFVTIGLIAVFIRKRK